MYEVFDQSLIAVQDKVRAAFGWSVGPDLESAEGMVRFVDARAEWIEEWAMNERIERLHELKKRLLDVDEIVILGAAVTEEDVLSLPRNSHLVIAADGAVGALHNHEHLACVVSDFDGGGHLDSAAKKGALIVAHAHGDNPARWRASLEQWANLPSPPGLILSHQTPEQLQGAWNFGGFTDGDRAVCFALAMGVERKNIRLVGFSLRTIGRWSGTTIPTQKIEKLRWMDQILESIQMNDAVDG